MSEAAPPASSFDGARIRSIAKIVIVLNLAYCGIEIAVAARIGSVSLFADSVDFLEDAAINCLVLAALGWSAAGRARLGMGLAGLLLVPSLATLLMAWHRFATGTPPEPVALTVTGFGALLVNGVCAWLLARYRTSAGSLLKAAFLSARNDTLANAAIILAGVMTAWSLSPWPDLGVGLCIAVLNADAAWEVWEAARGERD